MFTKQPLEMLSYEQATLLHTLTIKVPFFSEFVLISAQTFI
jgi:hypothetical protein